MARGQGTWKRESGCLGALLLVCWAAGHDGLTVAEDVEADDAPRGQMLAAALKARGSYRVVLRAKGSSTPWAREETDVADDGDGDGVERQERLPPALRDSVAGNTAETVSPECAATASSSPGEEENSQGRISRSEDGMPEAPALQPLPLWSIGGTQEETAPSGSVSPKLKNGQLPSARERHFHARLSEGHVEPQGPALSEGEVAAARQTSQVGSGASGGALDALLEHLEARPQAAPAVEPSRRQSLDQPPGAPGVRYQFLSPLAVIIDLAGAAGYVVNYLAYQLLVSFLPSSLCRSDRAVGVSVLTSWVATLPVKYSLHRLAGDLCGRGDNVTPGGKKRSDETRHENQC